MLENLGKIKTFWKIKINPGMQIIVSLMTKKQKKKNNPKNK